jgi:hypothetical protein
MESAYAMGLLDIELLSKKEIILHYILEQRQQGFILSYLDYGIIEQWLKEASYDADLLLVILSDELPSYLIRSPNFNSLRGIQKRVSQKIKSIKCNS